jgi:hypothetical protein
MELTDKLDVGDRVQHIVFGPGTVTMREAVIMGQQRGVLVKFDAGSVGVKELMWEFAHTKMERIACESLR